MSLNFADYVRLKIPEGDVTKITRQSDGVVLWQKKYVNMVPLSTTNDGKTIYNGTGFKNDTRLNSSAVDTTLAGYAVCGFIPVKAGDVVRMKGLTWDADHQTGCYFITFDSSFAKLKYERPKEGSTADITASVDANGVVVVQLESYATSVRYIRMSAYGKGENMIVTVNEEII